MWKKSCLNVQVLLSELKKDQNQNHTQQPLCGIILFTKLIFLTQSGLAHSYLLHMQRIRIHTSHYSHEDCWCYLETVD